MRLSIYSKFKNQIVFKLIVSHRNKKAFKLLKKNKGLWDTLADYLEKTKSTGCSYSDYWILYDYIIKNKPKEILECGTGVTTIVMSYALMENYKSGYGKGNITSIENLPEYLDKATELLPKELEPYVNLIYRKKTEYYHSIFRGVGYKDIPEIKYDLVFIDGPGTTAPTDGTRSFNFDFLNVLKRSSQPVYGIIDKRLGTCYVLQKILGKDIVKYDPKLNLGFIGPCSKKNIKTNISSKSFNHSLNIFSKNELNLYMEP